jgi:CheY-like chemotaxis protein
MLVEDNPNDVLLIKRAFKKAKIMASIQVLKNGDDAIYYLTGSGKFRNRNKFPLPGLILLDLKLPRRSGHETLAWIRKQPDLKRIPIVILTSSQLPADINDAYDLGANSYLIKPVKFRELLEIIRKIDDYWINLNRKPELC